MHSQKQFDLSQLQPEQLLTKEECKCLIKAALINPKNQGLYQIWQRVWFVQKYDLIPLIKSIMYYTQDLNISFVERVYRVYYDNYENNMCINCKTHVVNFDTFTVGFNKFCSFSCNAIYNKPITKLTEESRLQRSQKLSQARLGKKFTEEWKKNLKIAASNPITKKKKQDTCKKLYGTENPGVMGAYSSKSATAFIKDYLAANNIDAECCMFKDSNGSKEFWQMVFVPMLDKHKYMSYDLVIFDSPESKLAKDITKIVTVMEYNGPWHYTKDDIIGREEEPATPYQGNRFTKQQVYEMDDRKIKHILEKGARQVLIVWQKRTLCTRITLNNSIDIIEEHFNRDILLDRRLQ